MNSSSPKGIATGTGNQSKLTSDLKPHYGFIVCGSGSSGSVVAGRLTQCHTQR